MEGTVLPTLPSLLAAIPSIGNYISPWKLGGLLVLATPWLYVAPLIHKDIKKFSHIAQVIWDSLVLGAGIIGLLLWLLIPIYAAGITIYIVLAASACIAYVLYHNSRVENESDKILTAAHIKSLFGTKSTPKIKLITKLKMYDSTGRIVLLPAEDATLEQQEAYNLTQELLYDLLLHRVSQAEIAPAGEEARFRVVIDGVVNEKPPLVLEDSEKIIQYLKPLGGMNPQEHRKPQQGKISVDIAGSPIDINLASAGTTGGQRLVLKVVQEAIKTNIEELGMSQRVLQQVKQMASETKGLIIISGRRGNGVTSTLYSLLRQQDAYTKQLVTLESRAETSLENVTQHAYGQPSAMATTLASVIRRDADTIMIDQCQDSTTASIIAETAGSKLMLLGMNASDSFVAMAKWARACGNVKMAMENLKGVLCQVLMRKLCPTCREAYQPDPQMLAKANLPADKIEKFYRPPTEYVDEKGKPTICPTCRGIGYFGRTAAFELLEINDEIRQLIISGASLSQIKTACRRNKMLYLQEQALRKVIEGETSIQEVLRVSQQQEKKQ